MNDGDISAPERLEGQRGFRYRYSITNYAELISHLEDAVPESGPNPFKIYQSCFRKMIKICHAEILPSPEMELLGMAGLEHYLDPTWIPHPTQIPLAIEIIANAEDLAQITGEGSQQTHIDVVPRWVVKPSHYRKLRDVDGESFRQVMGLLIEIMPPISGADKEKLNKLSIWFMKLANFFFLMRPSNKKIHFDSLTDEERDRFAMAFTEGAGRLFHIHCTSVVKRIINKGKKVYTNDLYDMMQLLLLHDENRLFVTDDKSFYQYEIDSEIQRVVP